MLVAGIEATGNEVTSGVVSLEEEEEGTNEEVKAVVTNGTCESCEGVSLRLDDPIAGIMPGIADGVAPTAAKSAGVSTVNGVVDLLLQT